MKVTFVIKNGLPWQIHHQWISSWQRWTGQQPPWLPKCRLPPRWWCTEMGQQVKLINLIYIKFYEKVLILAIWSKSKGQFSFLWKPSFQKGKDPKGEWRHLKSTVLAKNPSEQGILDLFVAISDCKDKMHFLRDRQSIKWGLNLKIKCDYFHLDHNNNLNLNSAPSKISRDFLKTKFLL